MLTILLWLAACAAASEDPVYPAADWAEATPESQDLDAAKLEAALAYLREHAGRDGVDQVVIVRHGRLIWHGPRVDEVHGIWSATKVFTSTVLGLLIADGKATLETRAADVLPELAAHYPDLTLRHLTTMTSGYQAVGDEPQAGYRHGPSATSFEPNPEPLFAPGTQYAYWDSAMNLFGLVLGRLAGEPIEATFRRRVAEPLQMTGWTWGSLSTAAGEVATCGSGNHGRSVHISARELARLGLLFLRRGVWRGWQVVPAEWIEQATRNQVPADLPLFERSGADGRGTYGYNWWVNGTGADGRPHWPGAPAGTYAACGYNNNDLFVVPEWDMVVVRLGLDEADRTIEDETYGRFLELIGEAITQP